MLIVPVLVTAMQDTSSRGAQHTYLLEKGNQVVQQFLDNHIVSRQQHGVVVQGQENVVQLGGCGF